MSGDDKNRLSTEPYKGVRDFFPPEMAVQNYIFAVMRKAAESFGYVEYGASILEPSELYRSKTSSEIVNEQTYSFKDRGEREVTLRPEMTPTVARMIAARRRELAFPLRWYSIPNVFRYERPQRGRLREHWQLNADLFGVSGIEAETEIISLAYTTMKNFGAKDEDFEIRINSRKAMFEVYSPILKDPSQWPEVCRFLDKRQKLTEVEQKIGNEKYFARPFNDDDGEKFHENPLLKMISETLVRREIKVVIDPHLMRGFDYYTDIVFEVFDTDPKNNRSLFGGGRYDRLLEIFDEEPVPAVGFGMGDVTMRDFLETHDLLPKYSSSTNIYIATVGEGLSQQIDDVAKQLRTNGLNVAVDLTGKKVGDQIKTADRLAIPYVLVIGEEEIKTGKFKLKNLMNREEKECRIEEIAGMIKNNK